MILMKKSKVYINFAIFTLCIFFVSACGINRDDSMSETNSLPVESEVASSSEKAESELLLPVETDKIATEVLSSPTVTPVSTETPTSKPTEDPTAKPTATPTAVPTAKPTEKPIRSKYSFYRYKLSYEDNGFYINFPEGNDDPSWTGSGVSGPNAVTYNSLEEVRNVILTGKLSDTDISKMRCFFYRNEKGIILPDLYNLYIPVYPDGSSPAERASVTKEGYQVGGMIVMHEVGYNAAISEQSNYTKQEGITVTKTEKLSDKNGTVCYYTDQSNYTYKWVRYTLTKGSKTAVVDEIRVVQGGSSASSELNIYYEENGLYYALKSRGPSKWLTEEEIMGYGLKLYDVQVSKDILNQKDQEVMVVEKLTAMQKNHQTPETISVGEEYEGSKITPLEVYVMNSEANNAPVKKKGMKVWICDGDKNKIDYVYTNSNGVAFFEAPAGTYYFYFEGDEEYKDVYSTSITCWTTFTYAYTYDEMVPVNRICYTSRL